MIDPFLIFSCFFVEARKKMIGTAGFERVFFTAFCTFEHEHGMLVAP